MQKRLKELTKDGATPRISNSGKKAPEATMRGKAIIISRPEKVAVSA